MNHMTRSDIARCYDYLDKVHRVTRRIIAAFPEERLDWSPAEGARTPRQIIEHIYGSSVAHARAVLSGTLTPEDHRATEDAPKAGGPGPLLAWADRCWGETTRLAREATDEQLQRIVHAFYGDFHGWIMLSFNYDEHWHHRGQLTVYLRLLGIPVPFLYAYEPQPVEP